VSEIAAGTLPTTTDAQRPGFVRVILWTGLGGAVGTVFAAFAMVAPAIVGSATMPTADRGVPDWFPMETTGGVIANVAALLTLLWGVTWTIRGVFRLGGGPVPASTWTALTFAPALLLAVTPLATGTAAGLAAAFTLRYTAFTADGEARREPLDALAPIARHVLRVAIPVVTIGVATAYSIYHPLRQWSGGGDPIKPGRTPITVSFTTFTNEGGRTVEILGVEPGVERGYALHLTGVALNRMGVTLPGESTTRPFHPFTLKAHADSPSMSLVLSRAGCRPGATGAIESVRVRYRLGGERTALLRFDEPLRLAC
jgi:hypothetical protein